MRVTVFGSARLAKNSREYGQAVSLGRILAENGHTVITGGYGGLMEAVSRGAHQHNGEVVGITMTPWESRLEPNKYLSEVRAAETLFARLEALVESDALIALDGGAGTLAEVALAWNLRQMNLMPHKPIILVGQTWRRLVKEFEDALIIGEGDLALLKLVESVEEAVRALETATDQMPQAWMG